MSMTNETDFKVVDRRHSADSEEKTKKGDGFVMKESEPSDAKPSLPGQVDFSTLVLSLATSALIQLGLTPDPATQKTHKNLELAKQNIDILNLLFEKTKGNLTPDEIKLLDSLLTETKLRFVEAAK